MARSDEWFYRLMNETTPFSALLAFVSGIALTVAAVQGDDAMFERWFAVLLISIAPQMALIAAFLAWSHDGLRPVLVDAWCECREAWQRRNEPPRGLSYQDFLDEIEQQIIERRWRDR